MIKFMEGIIRISAYIFLIAGEWGEDDHDLITAGVVLLLVVIVSMLDRIDDATETPDA